jgi:hypothetical protein
LRRLRRRRRRSDYDYDYDDEIMAIKPPTLNFFVSSFVCERKA